MATIDLLPTEVLVAIFKNLSFPNVIACGEVSVKWNRIIALHFVNPHLEKLANYDEDLKEMFEKSGWTEQCTDAEKIWSIYNLPKVKNYPGMYIRYANSTDLEFSRFLMNFLQLEFWFLGVTIMVLRDRKRSKLSI